MRKDLTLIKILQFLKILILILIVQGKYFLHIFISFQKEFPKLFQSKQRGSQAKFAAYKTNWNFTL